MRAVEPGDAAVWARMRQTLWPSAPGEHAAEIAAFFAGERANPAEAFLALDEHGGAVGFAEASIRPYAEECYSGRVAYLEGIFVDDAHRRSGYGAALVEAVESWGRAQGCTELASDAATDNAGSIAAHRAWGFADVARVVCFRKEI